MSDLVVHMNGRRVGTLDTSDRRRLRFTYEAEYARDAAATPLSVSMPLRESAYAHAVVHPYLWGLLPDNERVLERWGREFGCSSSDVAGLLAGVGADVAGAAQYIAPGAIPEESLDGGLRWVSDAEIAQFLRDVERDISAWRPMADGRWSLAGAQAKIALFHDRDGDRWGVPHGAIPTTHIVKPAIAGLDDFDINEHLCLAAARQIGLVAAKTTVRTFGDRRALVVERYDRVSTADAGILRVHQEDLCQALAVHPGRKYESDGGPGSAQVGRLVAEVGGRDDPMRLYAALVFHWLVLATDGHAKNLSLLLSGHQVRLAPLYDVASGLPHLHPRKARLAQKIGGENRPTFIGWRHWERLAVEIGIDAVAARDAMLAMIDRMPAAFAAAIDETDLTRAERRVAIQIGRLVGDWVASCRRAVT